MSKPPRLACASLLSALLAGCGDSGTVPAANDSATPADLSAAADLTPLADLTIGKSFCCGAMGDPGNSMGVGKYCKTGADCTVGNANICATAGGDPTLTYCIFLCPPNDAGNPCGEGAACRCNNLACACVPDKCAGPKPDAC